jgi:hypothetical protein
MTVQYQIHRANKLMAKWAGSTTGLMPFVSERNRATVSFCRDCAILSRKTRQVALPSLDSFSPSQ